MPVSAEVIGSLSGYELKENCVVNKGFYCVLGGCRDDSPKTYPTPAEAWEACVVEYGLRPMMTQVCRTCGSQDVQADSYSTWSVKDQDWEVSQTFDKGAYCNKCDGETRIIEVEYNEKHAAEDAA
jgi:hypothetical protein